MMDLRSHGKEASYIFRVRLVFDVYSREEPGR